MQRVKAYIAVLICLLFGFNASIGRAEIFELENGNTLEGTLSILDEDGFIVRQTNGDFSKRTELVYLSQKTLKRLAQNPKYTELVTPFIDLPEEDIPPPEIIVRQPERLTREEGRISFLSTFWTPIGLLFIIACYLGNLLAAYEVAVYRGRSVPLVCGLSVILPVVTPIIFLSLPAAEGYYADHSAVDDEDEVPVEAATPSSPTPRPLANLGATTAGPSKLSLKQSAVPKKRAGVVTPTTHTRNDTEFNRHFFETTFSEFFRVVPTPAIKDMVLEFKGIKKEFIAKRVTRISANEIHIQLLAGKKEMSLGFGEIVQVRVRHKDDK
ncbi:MAG: hypothetical protein M2R45_00848 [Verrucomicrobia subdivision 3 bacterium]|nr:hypothetical protein [Limisphaerales bacterium]MCS1413046.1 hypothetical protein [Limisphaerales bacterium]